jgi:hypothetical protein
METNNENLIYRIGVENLLTITSDINIQNFYKERIKTDSYGAESIIRELDKTKLCNFICDSLDAEKQKIILVKLDIDIERLLK